MNFDKFTERAQAAMKLAHEAALQLGHSYLGTEHLIIGLLRENTGVAARMLQNFGVTEEKFISSLMSLTNSQPKTQPPHNIALTPRTKRVIDMSINEARSMGNNYVGTEHILIAVLRDYESVGVRVLASIGVDTPRLGNEIIRVLTEEGGPVKTPAQYMSNNTPVLNQYSRDLTKLAVEGKIDPVIGRSQEIERVIQILSRRTKNNPCLIGEPGVGKTAIAEGLAQKIIEGNVPDTLRNKRVVTLDLSAMVAGSKYRGEFEERIKRCMEEIKREANIVLFLDELHTIIGAGSAEGSIDAANILKPSLARGEIQMIGATTLNEYKKYVEKDAALERRFQPVTVGEPSVEETVEILKGIRDKYEAHHSVKITDNAILAAAALSSKYISDRFLPDKAIDLIDEAASKLKLKRFTSPPSLKEIEEKIEVLSKEKEEAVTSQEFEKAAKIRDEEKNLRRKLEDLRKKWKDENADTTHSVEEEDIAEIISSWTKIPVSKLKVEESKRLLDMEKIIHERVVGQNEAVEAVSKAIRRSRVGIKDPKRPIGSFIFLGPTGVGKTELSKALAEVMFGQEEAMIRLDMSEYMEKHSVSKLVGSPPGYVGFEEGGQLTEKVRRKPYSVILFDEIEKAHPDVFNILLQILEDGMLTDSQGRKVNFKNTVIIITSNVGARSITEGKKLGFGTADDSGNYNKIKSDVMEELKRTFKPEFLNRIDDIIVFHQLTPDDLRVITELMLKELSERIKATNDIEISFDEEVKDYLAKEGFDKLYGARPLRRTIQSKVEDMLAEKILNGELKSGTKTQITLENLTNS